MKAGKIFKKILVGVAILATGLFVSAGQARAYWETGEHGMGDGRLILCLYDEGGSREMGIDLGTEPIHNLLNQHNVVLFEGGIITPDKFDESYTNWTDPLGGNPPSSVNPGIRAGAFAYDQDYRNYFAVTDTTAPVASSASWASFRAGSESVQCQYPLVTNGQWGVLQSKASPTKSYDTVMNSNSNSPGYYTGFNSGANALSEARLYEIDEQGFVDLYLYRYYGVTHEPLLDDEGNEISPYIGVIRLADAGDGSVKVIWNPESAAVPIPTTLLLLGSGLVGLLGISRREAA